MEVVEALALVGTRHSVDLHQWSVTGQEDQLKVVDMASRNLNLAPTIGSTHPMEPKEPLKDTVELIGSDEMAQYQVPSMLIH